MSKKELNADNEFENFNSGGAAIELLDAEQTDGSAEKLVGIGYQNRRCRSCYALFLVRDTTGKCT